MLNFSTLSVLFKNLVSTGLVRNVYHSVILREDVNGNRKPSAPISGRYEYVGPDDQKGLYVYCRQTGNLETETSERMGSCAPLAYRASATHRLVFFSDFEERDFDMITAKLLKAVLATGTNVRFLRLITDAEAILQQEVPGGSFKFTTSTYYVAVEFSLLLKIQADTCEEDIKCEGIANPFC